MREIYLNGQTIVDELVGIVGMLANQNGSTLKDISCVVESLHGPVRTDVIRDGLKAAVLSGMLQCKNSRYKVDRQSAILGRSSVGLYDVAGCSSWSNGLPRDADSRDGCSISSLAQVSQYLGGETSRPLSECSSFDEIQSLKGSSDRLSSSSYLDDDISAGSLNGAKHKKRKMKGKKRLIVKLPMRTKKLTQEINTVERVDNNQEEKGDEKLDNAQKEEYVEKLENTHEISVKKLDNAQQEKGMKKLDNAQQEKGVKKLDNAQQEKGVKKLDTTQQEKGMKKLDNTQEGMNNNAQSQEASQNCMKDKCLDKNEDGQLPVKKNMTDVMTEVMKQFTEHKNVSNSEDQEKQEINKENKSKATHNDISDVMTGVMKKLNNLQTSVNVPKTPKSEGENNSAVNTIDGAINKVMRRFAAGHVQQDCTKDDAGNNKATSNADDGSDTQTSHVPAEPQEETPSGINVNKSEKRGKKKAHENYSNDNFDSHRYLTRSRTKANELRRSRAQSPSDSELSAKRAKLSKDQNN